MAERFTHRDSGGCSGGDCSSALYQDCQDSMSSPRGRCDTGACSDYNYTANDRMDSYYAGRSPGAFGSMSRVGGFGMPSIGGFGMPYGGFGMPFGMGGGAGIGSMIGYMLMGGMRGGYGRGMLGGVFGGMLGGLIGRFIQQRIGRGSGFGRGGGGCDDGSCDL